jgi:hypothetical protein
MPGVVGCRSRLYASWLGAGVENGARDYTARVPRRASPGGRERLDKLFGFQRRSHPLKSSSKYGLSFQSMKTLRLIMSSVKIETGHNNC